MAEPIDVRVKVAIYDHFARTGQAPSMEQVESASGARVAQIRAALHSLRDQRLLFLEEDGSTIRMAPPFSAVPTQHRVEVNGVAYFANCAWDALGIPAALHMPARVRSLCGQTGVPLDLAVGLNGPPPSSWLFHCLVPAAKWWSDLVFT